MVTHIDDQTFQDGGSGSSILTGIEFNSDGTKMFTVYSSASGNDNGIDFINEYDLSTPFDISTHTYAGDSERCNLANGWSAAAYDQKPDNTGDMVFSSNGMHIFVIERGTNGSNDDALWRYDLTKPFDVSTCSLVQEKDPDQTGVEINGWRSGSIGTNTVKHFAQGVAISPDGTKIFISFNGAGSGDASGKSGIREYSLSTPYDISTLAHVDSAGILLPNSAPSSNPDAITLSADGKKIFIVYHGTNASDAIVEQYSLSSPYDTTDFNLDGALNLNDLVPDRSLKQGRAIAFSAKGFKMFVSDDQSQDASTETMYEFDLACPFNLFAGKCNAITEGDRIGMAEAQIEIAKRTIDQSTDTALNRLKWIRRNKDKQNLTNLNINFNFNNQRLASLTEVVRTSAVKKKEKDKDEKRDIFYWSEGSVAIGRVGDTSISSTKEINTNRITVGADRFIDNKALRGLAFSVGRNNVDVGNVGSKVDADTYNLTYYSTSPMKDDEKFVDTIIGIGKIHSDILTVLDGKELTANRRGKQIFGTIKIKDEIKGDKFTLIPSGRFDIGHTLLDDYEEVGVGGIIVEKQHVRTKNLRAALAMVEDISNDKYTIKRHGKIEYRADIDRSSDFKYKYKAGSGTFTDTLHVGALHNITGELGIDIVFPENYSIFIIYERDQAIDYGHTDNLHIALGYLPNKNTNFAIQLEGINNTESNYVFSKNINDFILDFKLSNDLMNPTEYQEAAINLTGKF